MDVVNERLAAALKFDEYKYAICGVPFEQKWRLRITRNLARERALFDRLSIHKNYVLVHDEGSDFKMDFTLPEEIEREFQVIKISNITDNPFDWIETMERASMAFFVDSCFSNLADQLNMNQKKFLYLRSDITGTPVLRNNWRFI